MKLNYFIMELTDGTERTIRQIAKFISDNIEPKIYPTVEAIRIKGKDCVKVAFQGNDAPYFARGRAYIRVGDEDRQLSAKEIERVILKKNKNEIRWDGEICRGAKLSDISSRKLKHFLKLTNLKYTTLKSSLSKLNLLHGSDLLNSAIILFGNEPQKYFQGDLFYLIETAQEYVLKNIHIGMKIEGLRRIDVPEIDKDALREAIINAFCHRDYYEYDSVNLAIFKDRVEIRNPGLLYGNLMVEKIKREMISERRNEIIAEMFHRVHFIEKWGRGINLILSKEPLTDFKETGRHFVVTFIRKAQEKKMGGLVEGLVENQKKILILIKRNPKITKKELAAKIKISTTAMDNNINSLKKKGLLKRVGPDKGGYWEALEK